MREPVSMPESYTVDYIKNLPEGQRAELIDGVLYDMASPGTEHQRLSMMLSNLLFDYIRDHKGECEVFAAPFSVFLQADNKNYLEPDITVVCDKDKLDDDGCHGAPDLVIEITSRSTMRRDYGRKLFKYHDAGVREYWIVNPMLKNVTVNVFDESLGDENIGQFAFDEEISFSIYPDLSVKLSELL